MDHIRLPKEINRLDIKVPVFAKYAYDGAGFETYPFRQGYTTSPDEQIGTASFHKHQTDDVLSFIQAWLYFGLLREVIGPKYQQISMVSRSDYCVRTDELDSMLLKLSKTTASTSFDFVDRLLDFSWHQCNTLDALELGLSESNWTILLLSIRLLIHRIRQWCGHSGEGGVTLSAFPHASVPSVRPIREHMLQPGSPWCVHQFQTLVRKVSCSTLFYLANLKRFSETTHDECREEDHCIAYNVDSNHYTRAHCSGFCNHACRDVYPSDVSKMHSILDRGFIPVVECIRDNETGQFTLDYVVAAPGASYTAISHLWADGLGNEGSNSVYLCQLKRLFEAVSKGNRVVADHGPASLLTRYFIRPFHPLLRFLFGHLLPCRESKVYFWLDVYCVPVDASYDRARNLKNVALNRMTITYSWAEYVLILDNEISNVTPAMDYLEFASRVAVSGWNTRSWTYQEYSMGRILVFLTNGGVTLSDDIGLDYSIRHPSVGFQNPQGNENVKAEFHDLANLLFRPRLATGVRDRGDDKYSQKERSANFARVWNVLRDKTTTKSLDAILIFAMLLDLNPAEVGALRAEERMKAIARTFASLPLDFFFMGGPVTQTRAALGWLPSKPQGAYEIGRLGYCQMYPDYGRLRVTNLAFDPRSKTPLAILHISELRSLNCRFTIERESPQNQYRLQSQGGYDFDAQGREAIVLIGTSNLRLAGTIQSGQGSNGACLIVGHRESTDWLEVTSIHPVSVEPYTADVLCQPGQEAVCADRDFLTTGTELFINYDVSDWHVLTSRRDQRHAQRLKHLTAIGLLLTFIWIMASLATLAGAIFAVLSTLGSSLVVGPLGVAVGTLVFVMFGIYLLEFARTFYPRSIDYITMVELCSDFKHEDSRWQGMSDILPERGDRVAPGRWNFSLLTIVMLRWMVSIAKGCHWISSKLRSRRQEDIDGRSVPLEESQLASRAS